MNRSSARPRFKCADDRPYNYSQPAMEAQHTLCLR
jgi:hypothetical protein